MRAAAVVRWERIPAAEIQMRDGVMAWEQQGERTWMMQLAEGGADWVEVKRIDGGGESTWRVDARLAGSHHKVGDTFPTKEAAQGSALLLAMRLLPARRVALHAQLDAVPGAWWWKITPLDDASAEHRSIFSSRVMDSLESAERGGRAAGAGWWLYVYGRGSVRAFGQVPR